MEQNQNVGGNEFFQNISSNRYFQSLPKFVQESIRQCNLSDVTSEADLRVLVDNLQKNGVDPQSYL